MGPGADLRVYEARTPAFVTFDDEFVQIVNDSTLADVVTTSWGLCEPGNFGADPAAIASEDESFLQGTAQNQTFMAAAGDGGAQDRCNANNGPDNADFPSSDPNVIAAGGTSLFLNNDNTIAFESAWGGAGGADSVFFAEPAYETATPLWISNTSCIADTTANAFHNVNPITACTAAGNPSRQSSDIAMDADPSTGYSLYYNGRWMVFGGTSFVAPELAGLFAQIVKADGGRVGSGPVLIFCDATQNSGATYATDFNDVTTGNNGAHGIFDAGAGWDHPTGWGTPNAANFVANLVANCAP
jgi:kumamolisin